MTREDIIRMAEEAGAIHYWHLSNLERFAALVTSAAVRETSAEYRLGWNDGQIAEREACAQFIEHEYVRQFERPWRVDLSAAIRARGQA